MKLTLTIDCDNAAFADCVGDEVARILRRVADGLDGVTVIELGHVCFTRDANGNRVGDVRASEGGAA